jgi:hypothetical protein
MILISTKFPYFVYSLLYRLFSFYKLHNYMNYKTTCIYETEACSFVICRIEKSVQKLKTKFVIIIWTKNIFNLSI